MTHSLHYLKTYRERSQISLQDMAKMIGIDIGSLSKIEKGNRQPQLKTILAYHLILRIPIEKLFKNQYAETIKGSLANAILLKDKLLEAMTSPEVSDRINGIDSIIDQLIELDAVYGK